MKTKFINGTKMVEIKKNQFDYTLYLYENHMLLQRIEVVDPQQAEQMAETFVGILKPTLLNENS